MSKSAKSTKTTETQNSNATNVRQAINGVLETMGIDKAGLVIMSEQLDRVAKNVAALAERQLKKIEAAKAQAAKKAEAEKAKAEKKAAKRAALQAKMDELQKAINELA